MAWSTYGDLLLSQRLAVFSILVLLLGSASGASPRTRNADTLSRGLALVEFGDRIVATTAPAPHTCADPGTRDIVRAVASFHRGFGVAVGTVVGRRRLGLAARVEWGVG